MSAAQAADEVGGGAKSGAPLPATPDDVVSYVTAALKARDLDAFDRLIEWKDVRPLRRRMTLYQLRYSFGRAIKSAVLEPYPQDEIKDANNLLGWKPNLPITDRLRVVFDEPNTMEGDAPASVFLLGKEGGVYRMSLMLTGGPPK